MKILVPVKRVVDYNVKIRVKADGSGVETVEWQCGQRMHLLQKGGGPLRRHCRNNQAGAKADEIEVHPPAHR
ncbi:Electron transfer flavoprotein, beta subunit [Azospirillum palustre]